jgi:3-hydroxyisobutyrate dehydrogenase-like beta-hydroxyacid dehydrogenase
MTSDGFHTLGFIGTGVMGAPMVKRLLGAKFNLRVWNRSPSKLDPLAAAGALRADTPADAASGCDAVLLCLSDAPAVEAALFGGGGVAHAATPPAVLIDFSTIGPKATHILAQRLLSACGTSWVDAPVSGGAAGAEQGRLVIFCGGSAGDVGRSAGVFNALARRITRVGELGAGQTLKLCNQLIVASNLVAIAESLAMARASGLDMTEVPAALAGGFADSLPLQIFGPRMAAGVTSPVLGELRLMLKDVDVVADLAQTSHCNLPLMNAAHEVYRRAAASGLLREDLAALLSLYPAPVEPHA